MISGMLGIDSVGGFLSLKCSVLDLIHRATSWYVLITMQFVITANWNWLAENWYICSHRHGETQVTDYNYVSVCGTFPLGSFLITRVHTCTCTYSSVSIATSQSSDFPQSVVC